MENPSDKNFLRQSQVIKGGDKEPPHVCMQIRFSKNQHFTGSGEESKRKRKQNLLTELSNFACASKGVQ